MISSGHVIDGADSESNNSKKSIPKIKSGDITVSVLGIKYCWDIKGNNIKICVPPPTWRVVPNILEKDI